MEAVAPVLKLDLGCGPNKREGFLGVDQFPFDGKVDIVTDLRKPWPWTDSSVDEIHCSHFIEHLTNFDEKWERVHFFNELWRILKPEAKATLIFPHWCSARYYGDPTHKEPFSEMGFWYLDKNWRAANAPATDIANNPNGYSCDFLFGQGYNLHVGLNGRNQEFVQYAMQYYKESCQDIVCTLTKRITPAS